MDQNIVHLTQATVPLSLGLPEMGAMEWLDGGDGWRVAMHEEIVYAVRVGEVEREGGLVVGKYEGTGANGRMGVCRLSVEVLGLQDLDKAEVLKALQVVTWQYLPEEGAMFLAIRSGHIFLLDLEAVVTHGAEQASHAWQEAGVECVGVFKGGLQDASWSPDGELIMMATGDRSLILMNRDFDVLGEMPLDVDEHGEAVQVNVGWGSKSTQFHGSEGKAAALASLDAKGLATDGSALSAADDHITRLSWRGDGKFVCCSTIDPVKKARVIRVYNREGVLQSTSEPKEKLEHTLAWKPTGPLIATSQQRPHRLDVVFMERNGLFHGDFTLTDVKGSRIVDMCWNSDSTLLAIQLAIPSSTGANRIVAQVWNQSNYHWYLKQEIKIPGSDIVNIQWHPTNAMQLLIVTSDDTFHSFGFCHDFLGSSSMANEHAAQSAVIEGKTLHLTPFYYMNVPPPYSAFPLLHDDTVQHVCFGPAPHGNDFLVLERNGRISWYEQRFTQRKTTGKKHPAMPEVVKRAQLPFANFYYRQIAWYASDGFIVLAHDVTKGRDVLILNHFASDMDAAALHYLGVPAKRLVFQCQGEGVTYLQFSSNDMKRIRACDIGDIVLEDAGLIMPTTDCSRTAIFDVETESMSETLCVCLDNHNRLYVQGQWIMANCNSFCIHNRFLIASALNHHLYFYPLDMYWAEWKYVEPNEVSEEESVRRIEAGARVICAIPDKASVILQLPRGNLETISPRALVLQRVRSCLDSVDYRQAYMLCRTHRIDLNILFDHNPDAFFGNLKDFIHQINSIEYLNHFLSNLRNEDVTDTKYRGIKFSSSLHVPSTLPKPTDVNKVKNICEAIRAILLDMDQVEYIDPISTTFVRQSPPDLESPLAIFRRLIDDQVSLQKVENAIKYVIFLVDVDVLYDVALGMYDFELVLLIAKFSQKDPKEYIPFIESLQQLPESRRKFTIDDHLRRYESALSHLCLSDDATFEEIKEYTVHHSLYKKALTLNRNDGTKYKILMKEYGIFLCKNRNLLDAGIAYTIAESFCDAIDCFVECGNWTEVFSLIGRVRISDQEKRRICLRTIEVLVSTKDYRDASIICLEYMNDLEQAVVILLQGSLWGEAIRQAVRSNRKDLIESVITPKLIERHGEIMDLVQESMDSLDKKNARLLVVREEKRSKQELYGMMQDMNINENIDMMSDVGSLSSRTSFASSAVSRLTTSTRMSSKTAKSRRKAERRRSYAKEGSMYEEDYLVHSIGKLMVKIKALSDECAVTIRALLMNDREALASKLQALYDAVMDRMDEVEASGILLPENMVGPALPPRVEDETDGDSKKDKKRQYHSALASFNA